ncbi:trypsin-like serine protease [Candidatus Dependentiae bacterium]|nr:trypsin-like serine protease [Candidatus Dependentiae bacterium]
MICKKLALVCLIATFSGNTVLAQSLKASGKQQQCGKKDNALALKKVSLEKRSWADVFDEVKESVVQIFAYASPFNFQTPFKREQLQQGAGSGFFVMLDGELSIITNYHVVDNADVIYLQHPSAWQEYIELEFVGGSPEFDIARLQFKPGQREILEQKMGNKSIKILELGDSDLVRQGEEVTLVGYPNGEPHIKHATGIISGHESIDCGECFTTTAAAFPGNSGGACVSQDGKVVGILVAGLGERQGLNYVLPISREKVVLAELKNGKVLERPFWGISGAPTTPETFAYLNVPGEGGLLITEVHKKSLFDTAGMQKGDVLMAILAFNDRMPVDRFGYVAVPWSSHKMELADVLGRIHYADTFGAEVWRAGEQIVLKVTKSFDNPYAIKRKFLPFDREPSYEIFAGCVVMEMTMNHYLLALPRLKQYLNACSADLAMFTQFTTPENRQEPRLLVTHVFPESSLAKNRVFDRPLNVLTKVNGDEVKTIADYREAIQKSLDTGHIIFEDADGLMVVLSLADVIEQELGLAEKYNYQPSSMFLKIVK